MKRRGNYRDEGIEPGICGFPTISLYVSARRCWTALVALVKYLARCAAERDYAQHRKRREPADPSSGNTGDSR